MNDTAPVRRGASSWGALKTEQAGGTGWRYGPDTSGIGVATAIPVMRHLRRGSQPRFRATRGSWGTIRRPRQEWLTTRRNPRRESVARDRKKPLWSAARRGVSQEAPAPQGANRYVAPSGAPSPRLCEGDAKMTNPGRSRAAGTRTAVRAVGVRALSRALGRSAGHAMYRATGPVAQQDRAAVS